MPDRALPSLPRIGQSGYMPLLIEALKARHPTNNGFDSQIFLGLLLVLVAGERNLIVDVDVHSLINDCHDLMASQLPSGRGKYSPEVENSVSELNQQIKVKMQQVEERVRNMVERASSYCKSFVRGKLELINHLGLSLHTYTDNSLSFRSGFAFCTSS